MYDDALTELYELREFLQTKIKSVNNVSDDGLLDEEYAGILMYGEAFEEVLQEVNRRINTFI